MRSRSLKQTADVPACSPPLSLEKKAVGYWKENYLAFTILAESGITRFDSGHQLILFFCIFFLSNLCSAPRLCLNYLLCPKEYDICRHESYSRILSLLSIQCLFLFLILPAVFYYTFGNIFRQFWAPTLIKY